MESEKQKNKKKRLSFNTPKTCFCTVRNENYGQMTNANKSECYM